MKFSESAGIRAWRGKGVGEKGGCTARGSSPSSRIERTLDPAPQGVVPVEDGPEEVGDRHRRHSLPEPIARHALRSNTRFTTLPPMHRYLKTRQRQNTQPSTADCLVLV